MDFLKKTIVEPIKRNLAIVMLFSGIMLIILGVLIDEPSWAKALLNAGGAILGGGVFAVIVKSHQFSEIFQQHLSEVIYRPESLPGGFKTEEKWRLMTDAMLRELLPNSYESVSQAIKSKFFDDELEYHFEHYEIVFDIQVDGDFADVTNIHRSKVVLAPNKTNPILKQDVSIKGEEASCELKCFMINDKVIDVSEYWSDETKEENGLTIKKRKLRFPLAEYAQRDEGTGDLYVEIERVLFWRQDLVSEPYFMGKLSRFAKGFTVKYRVKGDKAVVFKELGTANAESGKNFIENDGQGFERRFIGQDQNLSIPGEGFIMILAPRSKGE